MLARSPSLHLALAGACLLAATAGFAAPPPGLGDALSVRWVFSMGADTANTRTPVLSQDRLYITHRGVLRCLDVRTGAEQWDFSPAPAAVVTSPILWEDLVIVGATDARLYALNAADGENVWERTCAGAISPDPLLLEGLLMVGAEEMVYAINPRSGQATWICALKSTAKAGPVSDGSMLYFLCQDSSVQCVDATRGRYRWRSQFSHGPRTFDPVVGQRRVIVASGRRIYGIARSSAIAWTAQMPAGVRARPVLVDDTLFVPCMDGHVYTLYARSGAVRHRAALKLDDVVSASPLITDTDVVVGTAAGMVGLLDRASGDLKWMYRSRTPEQAPEAPAELGIYAPVVGGQDAVYCLTGSGDLYCFSPSAPDLAGPDFAEFLPEPGSALPSAVTLDMSVAVLDAGSGVDPSSLEVAIDGKPVEVSFDIVSGLALMRYGPLADGSHVVKVTAEDYRGNVGSTRWSFLTDASIAGSPESESRIGGAMQPLGRAPRR